MDPTATSAAPLTSANPINSGDIGIDFLVSTLAFRGPLSITFSRFV